MSKYFQPHSQIPVPADSPASKANRQRVVEEFAGEPDKGNFQVGDHDAEDRPRLRGRS